MEHALSVRQTPTGIVGLLSCDGDMTIMQVQELYQSLFAAILEVDTLNIDVQDVGVVDISFLQLLCSAHRECLLSGKNICLRGCSGESIARIMEKAGYRKGIGCSAEAKDSCLWEARTMTEAVPER